jgi:hypothetical protein
MNALHIENQRQHCIRRLRERFNFGAEDYWAILGMICEGAHCKPKKDKEKNKWRIRLKYKKRWMTVVYDSSTIQLVTVLY